VCLAGWPDHPRRAVDQSRDTPARADPTSLNGRAAMHLKAANGNTLQPAQP